MPFGLIGVPNTFMRLMTEVLKPFLGEFIIVYLDDIVVYSRSLELHTQHLRKLFEGLRKHQLYGNLEKCAFLMTEVSF